MIGGVRAVENVLNRLDAQFDLEEDKAADNDYQASSDFVYRVNMVFVPTVIGCAIYYWLHW